MCIINKAPEIHSRETSTSRADQFVAELIAFGRESSNLPDNSSNEYPKVRQPGRSAAEVTEAREHPHYDWTDSSEMGTAQQEYWDRH